MTARVLLKRLKGKMRFCWKPTQIGPSWFCFVGDPCIDVHIDPLLGHRLFNMTAFPKVRIAFSISHSLFFRLNH